MMHASTSTPFFVTLLTKRSNLTSQRMTLGHGGALNLGTSAHGWVATVNWPRNW